ncbi:MAG: tetratricopeptide repeat protein, partial [Bacteroidales bacterium]|nr:tetratricopeptide repeat protein [Bacteroidales bacterium]
MYKIIFVSLILNCCTIHLLSNITTKQIDSLEKKILQTDDNLERAQFCNEFSKRTFTTNPQLSVHYAYKALKHLKNEKDDIESIKSYRRIARYQFNLTKYDSAIYSLRKALNISISTNNYPYQCGITGEIGLCVNKIFGADSSAYYYRMAIKIAEEHALWSDIYIPLSYLANYLSEKGMYNKAIENLNKATKYSENSKDSIALSSIYLDFGKIYWKLNDQKQALEYLLMSKEICQKKKKHFRLSSVLVHIGQVYIN